MNCVTPKGQVCVFVEADNMVVLGEEKENSVKLDWGKIELAVGDKVKITAIEGMEYDTIYMSNMTDEDMLGYYNQLKKFLTKEGIEVECSMIGNLISSSRVWSCYQARIHSCIRKGIFLKNVRNFSDVVKKQARKKRRTSRFSFCK